MIWEMYRSRGQTPVNSRHQLVTCFFSGEVVVFQQQILSNPLIHPRQGANPQDMLEDTFQKAVSSLFHNREKTKHIFWNIRKEEFVALYGKYVGFV